MNFCMNYNVYNPDCVKCISSMSPLCDQYVLRGVIDSSDTAFEFRDNDHGQDVSPAPSPPPETEWTTEPPREPGKASRLRPEVQWFADGMETKLRLNDHKSPWTEMTFAQLLHRLGQEVKELRREIGSGKLELVGDEACDVANFAMMIADNARRIITPQPVPIAPPRREP